MFRIADEYAPLLSAHRTNRRGEVALHIPEVTVGANLVGRQHSMAQQLESIREWAHNHSVIAFVVNQAVYSVEKLPPSGGLELLLVRPPPAKVTEDFGSGVNAIMTVKV